MWDVARDAVRLSHHPGQRHRPSRPRQRQLLEQASLDPPCFGIQTSSLEPVTSSDSQTPLVCLAPWQMVCALCLGKALDKPKIEVAA